MNSTKKNKPASDDPVNTKIQRQFNLVFDKDKSKSPNENKKEATIVEEDYDLSPKSDDSTKASLNKTESATISLDLKTDSSIKLNPLSSSDEQGTVVASLANDATKSEGLDFSLDFNLDGGESTVIAPAGSIPGAKNDHTVATSSIDVPEQKEASLGGFVLDELDLAMNLSESTQKTVIANLDLLKGGPSEEDSPNTGITSPNELNLDAAAGGDDDFNLLGMSKQEEKAIIESTIKDIVRPKFEPTTEMDLNSVDLGEDFSDLSEEPMKEFRVDNNAPAEADSNVLDFGGNTPGDGFNLDALKEEASKVDLGVSFDKEESSPNLFAEAEDATKAQTPQAQKDDEFSLLSDDDDIFSDKTSFDSADSIDDAFEKTLSRSLTASMKSALAESGKKPEGKVTVEEIKPKTAEDETLESLFDTKSDDDFNVDDEPVYTPSARTQPKKESSSSIAVSDMPTGSLNTEDSMRFQATIRALREEREDLLGKIKLIKSESKELEQDNLTLKANLDEAKIEITILRKRHMVELEDLKYRLSMSEEKKALAEEKARQAEMRKEKLEQKVRIDFNQVKQREKELESKLELLSMDVDSQVQSRDQKILELRRKIDALEFNMENASIKEQKSLDDKRKLEDRLNKIMKTLRHSIKNLEDDIDHASDENDREKDKN